MFTHFPWQVTIGYQAPKTYVLTPSRKRYGKLIARGSCNSIARQCLDDVKCRQHVIAAIGHQIKAEVWALCANNMDSVQRNKDAKTLKTFSWDPIVIEAKQYAPTLFELLRVSTQTNKKTVRLQDRNNALIGLCISVICKHRNPSKALFQRVVSLVLYAWHSGKKVCNAIIILFTFICAFNFKVNGLPVHVNYPLKLTFTIIFYVQSTGFKSLIYVLLTLRPWRL